MVKNYTKLRDFLFLFDIDGTILDSRGAGKNAFIKALHDVLNINDIEDICFLGGIDNVIFKNIYDSYDFPADDYNKAWQEFQSAYIENLKELAGQYEWHLYPNVGEVIKFLNRESNIALVTGNIEKGAVIKLQKFDLDTYFKCGGYGDNAPDRKDFVKDAIIECEAIFNKRFNKKNIYLFGDTDKDVKSAHDNGITPVLIDHHNRYVNQAKALKTLYYHDFTTIEHFFKEITE